MKTIGIIGGMGPLATADLYRKIIVMTDAQTDQEHPHVIIDGNTLIPDRTAAILGNGPDPLPQLIGSAARLEAAGADFLLMACNTAHFFYDAIAAAVRIPILHMLRETVEETRRRGHKKVALLATDGTVRTGIYRDAFRGSGVELVVPGEEGQAAVMEVIYDGVKKGRDDFDAARLNRCLDALLAEGAETLILGCTELPVAFAQYGMNAPSLDPTTVLAAAAVKASGCRLKDAAP